MAYAAIFQGCLRTAVSVRLCSLQFRRQLVKASALGPTVRRTQAAGFRTALYLRRRAVVPTCFAGSVLEAEWRQRSNADLQLLNRQSSKHYGRFAYQDVSSDESDLEIGSSQSQLLPSKRRIHRSALHFLSNMLGAWNFHHGDMFRAWNFHRGDMLGLLNFHCGDMYGAWDFCYGDVRVARNFHHPYVTKKRNKFRHRQGQSTLDNVEEWEFKLAMLMRNNAELEVVSREKKDRRDFEHLSAVAARNKLYSRQYSKVVVFSKVPLPNYRPDLDDKRPQREVLLPVGLQREVNLRVRLHLSERSIAGGSLLNKFAGLSLGGDINAEGGLNERKEPPIRNSIILEKIHHRRSLQLREKQQEWQ
ncbi:hypothetical protein CRG98_019603, partial [Punica granatum]